MGKQLLTRLLFFAVCITLLLACGGKAVTPPRATPPPPPAPKSRLDRLRDTAHYAEFAQQLSAATEAWLARERIPGAVVAIGQSDGVLIERAFGYRQLTPKQLPTLSDTVYDLASLTKPVATALSVMVLVESGRVDLKRSAAYYLPEFAAGGKSSVTVEQLLAHTSGLPPVVPIDDFADGPEQAWRCIAQLKLQSPPGSAFRYSDLGYIALGKLVERVSGLPLDEFARRYMYAPLKLRSTMFRPNAALAARAAATSERDGQPLVGIVEDPRAYRLGGVAGNAGLFSTAGDLGRIARMLLAYGELDGTRVMDVGTVTTMIEPITTADATRALGWDMRSVFSKNRSELFSPRAFGHTGYSGTSLWIDPTLDLYVIVLSNRVHVDATSDIKPLAAHLGNLAAMLLMKATGDAGADVSAQAQPQPAAVVQTGIDVLERWNFRPLAGKRVGLITNNASRDSAGRRTIDALHAQSDTQLVAIFSPEHGLEGRTDGPVRDARDPESSLPVYSLFNAGRAPTPAQLRGIDALVFDLQDVGTRFYTYIATLGLAMEVAAKANLPFFVLDRPNPVGGDSVAGPLPDPGREAFVSYHRLPIRHGMTVGELALLFQNERKLKVQLTVIPMEGWRRTQTFDQTGLAWVPPSPAMQNVRATLLYPGLGLLENTALSVGRGTKLPFELIGAPYIHAEELAAALNARGIAGATFVPVRFTPEADRFKGEACGGVRIAVDPKAAAAKVFDPVRIGFELALTLQALYPTRWKTLPMDRLLRHRALLSALPRAKDYDSLEARWRDELSEFMRVRERYLLY